MKLSANTYLITTHRFFFTGTFLICMFLLPAQTSFAQTDRWLFIGADSSGAKVYLDGSSVDQSINGFFAWDKIVSSNGSYTINRSGWDCENKQHLIVTSKIYNSQGIFVKTVTGQNLWRYITPDSVAESLYNTVCRLNASESLSAEETTVRVASKMANIRESPTLSAPVVSKAAKGRIFLLVNPEAENGWYHIYFSKDKTAWIHKSTVE